MQTITKVYDSYEKARRVVDRLETAGIGMSEISVLGNRDADVSATGDTSAASGTEASQGVGLGAAAGGAAGLLAGLGLVAIPGIGPVVAAGWLSAMAAGIVAGGATGGLVGALISSGVPEDHAHVYSEAVRRGGTMVSVQAEDHEVETVHAVLDGAEPLDPNQQGSAYRETGWKAFDPDAGPYESTRAAAQRTGQI